MSWVAAGVASASVVSSIDGAQQAKKTAKKQQQAADAANGPLRESREGAAKRLEELAQKLESGQPISDAERNVIDRAAKVTDKQLQQITQDATQQSLEAQAGTGFLKSGRMANQVRKIQIEGSLDRQKVAVAREQQLQNLIERRRQMALQANTALLNMGVPGAQQIPQGLPGASIAGAGLSSLAGSLFQSNAQQNQAQQNQAMLNQPQQPQAVTRGVQRDPGVSGVSAQSGGIVNSQYVPQTP